MAKKESAGGAAGTEIAGKKFAEYWSVIMLPVVVVVAWSVLQFLIGFVSPSMYGGYGWSGSGLLGSLGMLIGLIAFLYIGWNAFKTHKYELTHSVVAGGIAGVIAGLAGIVLQIISAAAGRGYGAMGTDLIGIIIFGIVGGAIIGAILAGIGAFAAENVK